MCGEGSCLRQTQNIWTFGYHQYIHYTIGNSLSSYFFYTSLSPIFSIVLSNSKFLYVLFKTAILKTIYQVPPKKLLSILSLRFPIFSFSFLFFFTMSRLVHYPLVVPICWILSKISSRFFQCQKTHVNLNISVFCRSLF